MKKILLLVAVLFSVATTFAQYSAPVKVVIQNKTKYNLYYAARYHLAFYDGAGDNSFFGLSSPNSSIIDFNYQPEGIFEPVLLPGQTRTYSNSTLPGYPLQANSGASTFNTSALPYQSNVGFFHKYMRLDWLRYAFSNNTLTNAFYGGGIAHPVPSGFSLIAGSSPAAYLGNNIEMVIPYWPSTFSFTYNGVTVYGVWTATAYVPGQAQTVNILFYQ